MKEEKYLVLEEMERFFRTPNLAPPFLYISLAYYLAKLGDLDSAQEALAKAEDSKQKHAQAYWFSNQARIHLLKGDPTAALEASTRAVELSNQQADILATHGLMLLRNGELQKAKEQLDAAISIEGKNTRNAAEISYFRAELFEKNGDKQSAEEDLKYAKWNGYIPYL